MQQSGNRSAGTRASCESVRSILLVMGAGCLVAAQSQGAPSLTAITPLGDSIAIANVALSADGATVVGARPLRDEAGRVVDNRSFVWTREGGFRPVEQFVPGSPGLPGFRAYDVSGDGSRIVGALDEHPVFWDRNGAMTSLDLLPGGPAGASVLGVSDDGRFAVGSAHDGGIVERFERTPSGETLRFETPRLVPVRWSLDDGGVIALSTTRGQAVEVANTGVAVGGLVQGEQFISGTAGFRWDPIRGPQFSPTGDPTSASDPFSSLSRGAFGISADGTTIVGHTNGPPPAGSVISGTVSRAYLWTGDPGTGDSLPADGLTLIDATAVGATLSVASATAVSADGSTVVGHYLRWENPDETGGFIGTVVPFVWTQAGGFQDLIALLNSLGVAREDWDLFSPTDVSADGKTIIGTGHSGVDSGSPSPFVWIAVIPEPSTALLLGAGLSILAGQARSSRSGHRSRPVLDQRSAASR